MGFSVNQGAFLGVNLGPPLPKPVEEVQMLVRNICMFLYE